jgi:uncharacterized membrane protein YeaQ/YmgE (transglycosylase-associated protein family)
MIGHDRLASRFRSRIGPPAADESKRARQAIAAAQRGTRGRARSLDAIATASWYRSRFGRSSAPSHAPGCATREEATVGVWSLIVFLVVGLVAGWLAGNIMKGRGFGLLGNLVVGVIGSFVGGFLFRLIGLGPTHIVGSLIAAVVGAIVLLYVVGLLKKA